MTSLDPLISELNLLLSHNIGDDVARCTIIAERLRGFLRPDWLPPEARIGGNDCYQRHLIYEDSAGRFCVGSFVWKPGQETPVHDHACWGVFGVVRGCLSSENFILDAQGELHQVSTDTVMAGCTAWLSPAYGDIHRIANRAKRTTALSLHVYGARFAEVCRTRYDNVSQVSIPFSPPVAASLPNTPIVG